MVQDIQEDIEKQTYVGRLPWLRDVLYHHIIGKGANQRMNGKEQRSQK